jgi:catechol 2,3-dioxygenase-like lactoylglutathione lyase family enzyme
MLRMSHRGICVADLAASDRFYREALGFEAYMDHGVVEGPDMARTMQLPGVRVRCPMLRHPDGPVIELLHFLTPPGFGPREPRPLAQFGLIDLCFRVADLDVASARIVAAGGRIIGGVDATLLFATDPDGVRIGLIRRDDAPAGFSHSTMAVADLGIALHYYAALGFAPVEDALLDGAWLGPADEAAGLAFDVRTIRDGDGNTLRLVKMLNPAGSGPRERRALNQLGLTHLAFWDDAPDPTCAELTTRGGHFVAAAHVVTPQIELRHGADPDGIRIELMTAPA